MSKLRQGWSSYFFLFEFGQILLFCVGISFSYFFEIHKISAIFLGLKNFQLFFGSCNIWIPDLNPLNEEHTALKSKIIVAFQIIQTFIVDKAKLNKTLITVKREQ